MKPISRRQMLTVTGLTVGGGLLSVHSNKSQANNDDKKTIGQAPEFEPDLIFNGETQVLQYTPIASKQAANRAYEFYPKGSCMYAVVKGIVSTFAQKKQSTISPLFYNLFKYGHGGSGGWGSICGACNGAAAVMGLFCEDKKTRDKMINELFRWYESTTLPMYVPANSANTELPASVAESILCHISVNQWCTEADMEVCSPERKERCRRLSADVAQKTVEILNAQYAMDRAGINGKKINGNVDPATCQAGSPESCIACHSTRSDEPSPKVSVRMNCSNCHEVSSDHPK